MIQTMKNTKIHLRLAAAATLLLASPLMAKVADPPSTTPRLDAIIQPAILWGAAGLFTLLILIIAFKNPKRNFYDPKV